MKLEKKEKIIHDLEKEKKSRKLQQKYHRENSNTEEAFYKLFSKESSQFKKYKPSCSSSSEGSESDSESDSDDSLQPHTPHKGESKEDILNRIKSDLEKLKKI